MKIFLLFQRKEVLEIGRAILLFVAKLAKNKGCGRLEWSCLDWNKPSIEFYKSIGAKQMYEWSLYILSGENLDNFVHNMN